MDRLTVAVDDAALGRQLLSTPRTELPGPLDADAAWSAVPPLGEDAVDVEVLRALCRLALRGARLEGAADDEFDAAELALRALGGVEAVAADATQDVVRVKAPAGSAGSPPPVVMTMSPGLNQRQGSGRSQACAQVTGREPPRAPAR